MAGDVQFALLYRRLLAQHGAQHWWPAASRFEIIVGALLVQRTTWHNAAAAVEALRGADLLDPGALSVASEWQLGRLIKPAGFHSRKAPRLRALAAYIDGAGGVEGLDGLSTSELRDQLIALDGIGAETADAILLYAFERAVFIVDAYALRLFDRLSGSPASLKPGILRSTVVAQLPGSRDLNEFHALIVAHGKTICRRIPRCERCSVQGLCRTAADIDVGRHPYRKTHA